MVRFAGTLRRVSKGLTLFGRQSSHYTRVARIFVAELAVPCEFRPVLDLAALDEAAYAGNPALKVPVLHGPNGALFGTANICRELERRAERPRCVLWSESFSDPVLANAQELVLHVMNTGVALVMARLGVAADVPPTAHERKLRATLKASLEWLEARWPYVLRALPPERELSFLEVTAFSVLRHLPFRKVCEVAEFSALAAFADEFEQRPSAQATPYRFDAPA